MCKMNAFTSVVQTVGTLSYLASSLPSELLAIITVYGKALDNIPELPITSEEIAWLLSVHKKFGTASYKSDIGVGTGRHHVGYWCEWDDTAGSHVSDAMVNDAHFTRGSYISMCRNMGIPVEEVILRVVSRYMIDVGTMLRLTERRFQNLGLDPMIASTMATQTTMEFLTKTFDTYIISSPIFLEMYLYVSAMILGLVEVKFRSSMRLGAISHLKWSLSAPRGGKLDEELGGIVAKCHEHYALLLSHLSNNGRNPHCPA